MKRLQWVVLGAGVTALSLGCGNTLEDETSTGTGGETEESDAEAGTEPASDTAPQTTSSTTDATTVTGQPTTEAPTTDGPVTTTGEEVENFPASDIRVDWVEANQGIGVRIGAGGGEVGPEDRTAFLLSNRITLVRAFWRLDDDFVPREIEAHLVINYPDGTSQTFIDSKMVEGESFIGSLSESFFWGLMPEEATPGITYHVEFFEADAANAEPDAEPARLPNDGTEAFVGIEDSYQLLKIVIVPFNYDDGADCQTSPDLSEETMQLFEDSMFMMNPVDQVQIEIHESVDWNEALAGFPPLNQFMSDLRFDEEAPPETYYYGLIDVCAGGLGGAGGQAFGIPTDPTDPAAAYQRVSSGLSLDPDWSAETFVHEVGHSQGRRHVACNGEEGGPDPTYPIEGGDVGEWGFGIIDFQLRHPTVHKDYMTYCHPTWVSTWGWNKVYPIIEELSTWDENYPGNGAPKSDDPYRGELLVGMLLPSGEEYWQTVPGALADVELSDATQIEFRTEGNVLTRQAAQVTDLPDAEGQRMIVTPLPAEFSRVDDLVRVEGNTRTSIDRAAIKVRNRHSSGH